MLKKTSVPDNGFSNDSKKNRKIDLKYGEFEFVP